MKNDLISGLMSLSFVGILYLIPSARSRPNTLDHQTLTPLDRQHPKIIRARIWASSLITILIFTFTYLLIQSQSFNPTWVSLGVLLSLISFFFFIICFNSPPPFSIQSIHPFRSTLSIVGLLPLTGTSTRLLLQPLLLTITLFLGPIYTSICLERSSFSYHDFNDLQAFRNLIIGPLTEEIVFRGCIIAVSLITPLDQRPSAARIIFISPLWFGAGEDFFFLPPSSIHFTTHPYSPSYLILAHIHSIRETYLTRGRNVQALKIALTIASEYDPRSGSKFKFKSLSPFSSYLNQTQYLPGSVFQFGYTTIFGWYASFIHLRTGQSSSLTIQAHSSLLIIISLSHSRISLGSHSLS